MKIIIARHAQVKKNLQNIDFHDSMQGDLTEEGKRQSIELFYGLKPFDIKKIFTSQSPRTLQTARPFIDKFKLIPEQHAGLNEVNFGIFSNLSKTEAAARFPEIFEKREKDKYNFKLPEGESFREAGQRIESFFNELPSGHISGDVLLITHATVLKIFLVNFFDKSMAEADKVVWKNCSYLVADWNGRNFKLLNICK